MQFSTHEPPSLPPALWRARIRHSTQLPGLENVSEKRVSEMDEGASGMGPKMQRAELDHAVIA